MLFILEMLLSYLIENKDKKIEASALNKMLEEYKEELEKEQHDEIKIKNSYLKILENINYLLINKNNNNVVENLTIYVNKIKEETEPLVLESFASCYNDSCGTLEDINKSDTTLNQLQVK